MVMVASILRSVRSPFVFTLKALLSEYDLGFEILASKDGDEGIS